MTVKGFGDGGFDEPCPPEEMADPDPLKYKAMLLNSDNNDPNASFKHDPWALLVEWEEGDLTDVRDCVVTSNSEKAQPVVGRGQCLHLTQEQVRWLHARLGELIALQDKAP
jgi:hypothetical protein